MATDAEVRAFAAEYAARNTPSAGAAFVPSGSDPMEQEIRDFAAQWAMQNTAPEGSMRAREIRDFASDYEAETSFADEFGRGLGQGTDMLQASMYAMTKTLGRELGIDTLHEFGERGLKENIEEMSKFGPTVAGFTDIDTVEDFVKWSASAFGQAIPSLGTAFAGGGIGGVLAKKAVEKSVFAAIRSRMMREMTQKGIAEDVAEEAVERALRSKTSAEMLKNGFQKGEVQRLQRGFAQGSTIGTMVPSSAMQAGETEMTLSEAGIDGSLLAVFGTGFVGGALEALPALKLINKVFPGVDKAVAGSFIKDFVKATGTQALIEGSTEGAQEVIQLASLAWHDPSFDLMDPENARQVIDAFAAGALVGAVTGGGAETVGRFTRGEGEPPPGTPPGYRPNLPGGPATEAERVPEVPSPELEFPEGFEPADNTVFEEVKRQAQDVVDEKLAPALNKVSTAFNEGQDKVRGLFTAAGINSPFAGMAKYRENVAAGQDEFLAGHEPVIADTVRYASEYAMYVADAAMDIPAGPERQAFIDEQMAELSQEVGKVSIELGLRGDKMIGSVMREIEGDPIYEGAPADPDQVDTEFVFGQMFAYKNEQGNPERYRTRGDNARPYPTYEAAANNLESVIDKYPSAPASAFSIRGNDETGYTIAINDSGLRQQLREDEVVYEALEKSRTSARGNPDETRHVKVKLPKRKANVILDVPTLVFEGKRLGEGDTQSVQNAFDGMMARLFERGEIDDASYQILNEAFEEQFPGRQKKMTLNQAKRFRDDQLAKGNLETKPAHIISKGKNKKGESIPSLNRGRVPVKQTAARGEQMNKTIRGDLTGPKPGVTGDTGFETSFRKGVKGSKKVTPKAKGKRAGTQRMATDEFGQTVDTDPEADNRQMAAQIEKGSKTKLPTERQQAQQSLIDAGGTSTTRSRKRDRKRTASGAAQTNPLFKNIERLKGVLAKFPSPKNRTKQENAEFKEIAAALAILERKPRSAKENNKVNRVIGKLNNKKYTTSGIDPTAPTKTTRKSKAQKAKKVRNKLAEQDSKGDRTKVLKPKPLKFKWIATAGAVAPEGDSLKHRQAAVIQSITSKGLHIEVGEANKPYVKGITWLVKKVQALVPNSRIIIADKETLLKWRESSMKDMRDLSESLLAYPSQAIAYMHQMDTAVIRVDDFSTDLAGNTLALIHELGHLIQYNTWTKLGIDGQQELWEAFKADIKAGKRATGAVMGAAPSTATDANLFEFKEWMADQFVVWVNNRKAPKNALHRFFQAFDKQLKKLYDIIKGNPGRYGMELNQTYAEFADSVARRAAKQGDPATDRFFSNNKVGALPQEALNGMANSLDLDFKAARRDLDKVAKTKVTKKEIDKKIKQSPYKGLELERWKEAIPKELSYNEIMRSQKQLVQLVNNLYNVAMAPSTSVMRGLSKDGIKAADKLVQIFNRLPGKPTVNYHQQVKRMSRGFMNRFSKITENMSEAQKTQLMEDMKTGANSNTLRHRQMRKLFNDVHAYLKKAGLPVGKIENYVPKMFNKQKLLDNQEAIQIHYAKMYMKDNPDVSKRDAWEWAKVKFNALISKEAEQAAAEQELQADELSMQAPGFSAMRHRYSKSKFMDQFLEDSLDAVVGNYVNQAVKRAEYNRALGSKAKPGLSGGDMLPRKMWNPQQKLEAIMNEAKKQGATDIQLMRMKNYVDANLGMYGRDDVSEGTRKFMAGLVAYNNMRVLLFTVFASLPDLMGPVIRSNDAKTAFKEFSSNIKAIVNGASQSELAQMAEALGIITDDMSQHVLTEYVDNHYMPAGLRKWNDRFFKYTGLNWYTDATRKYALAVGVKSLENAAQEAEMGRTKRQRSKAKRFLKEFGVTPEDVRGWVAAGKPVYNSGTYATQAGRNSKRDNKIAAALVQFVDESIMSPNPSQRPIAASHPGLMLVYHLKGFMYAIYDIFLKRMKYNWDEARTAPEHLALAIPVVGMLVLTAAGIELRDLITGNDTKGRMDNWEYSWTLIERAGLLGPAQLGWDFEGAGDRGQSELIALAGPALSQAGDLISRPVSQTIPKAIPVVSQLPWMRAALRGDYKSPDDKARDKKYDREMKRIAKKDISNDQKSKELRESMRKKEPKKGTIYYDKSADRDTQARQIASQLVQMKLKNPNYRVSFNANRLGLNNHLLARTAAYYVAFAKAEGIKP